MKHKVVVELRGGAFVGLYAADPETEYCLVDWDKITEASLSAGVWNEADPLDAMPSDTRQFVLGAVKEAVGTVKR